MSLSPNGRIALDDQHYPLPREPFKKDRKGTYLTFGRHSGKRLHAIPQSYLEWLADATEDPELLVELDIEITSRLER